ncbi:glycosyltransferase [Vampirovibrio chlorellavorus]|uniref:glycosyltransferase n=1 Tax=Vampirovibrio chlorellavorus TaxID=758823 RepID=UPI0026E9B2B7|nr:glycosyltransferase [Vampirovibrio chlorellavorus]
MSYTIQNRPQLYPDPRRQVRFGAASVAPSTQTAHPANTGIGMGTLTPGLQGPSDRLKIRFGSASIPSRGNIDHQPQNGVWITTERIPAKVGGLGEVSKTIPEAFAQFTHKKDLRIIVPYMKAHRKVDQEIRDKIAKGDKTVSEADLFQPTGTFLSYKTDDHRTIKLEVLQKFESATGFEEFNHTQPEEKRVGNWVYALRNDNYFIGKNKYGLETEKGLSDYTYTPEAGEFDKVMLFNRAASELVPLLDGNNPDPRAARLKRFNNLHKPAEFPVLEGVEVPKGKDFRKSIDFVIAHDWLTGPVNNELADDPYTRKHFVVHNMFDKEQAPHVAHRAGLLTPNRLFDQERTFSALNAGIEPADSIWVNNNFKRTMLESTLPNGAPFISTLRQKSEDQRTYNLHHGLSSDYTASGPQAPRCLEEGYDEWHQNAVAKKAKLETEVETLKEKFETIQQQNDPAQTELAKEAWNNAEKNLKKITTQITAAEAGRTAKDNQPYKFQKLEVHPGETLPTAEQMQAFKRANKMALQKKLGLKQDTNAPIIAWAARLDPRQKNVYVFMKSVDTLLANNPDVQVVMVGDTTDPEIIKWIEGVNKKYNTNSGENRVYIPNVFATQDEVKQINAGADFTALPSLYEPYGLTQLEAMKMGSLPVVHGVDGLRTTVSEPDMNAKLKEKARAAGEEWEPVWDKPQNGFLMDPLDIDQYKEYIDDRQDYEHLERLKAALVTNRSALEALKSKPDAKEEAKLKAAEQKAFVALLGKMEGLANTLDYKLKSFEIQRKDFQDALARLEADPTASPQRKKAMEEKRDQLSNKIKNGKFSEHAQEIRDAHRLLKENPQDLETQYNKVLTIIQPNDEINQKAADKLTDAFYRGFELLKSGKDTETRINAIKYVDTEHSWEKIIQNYYLPALESNRVDAKIREQHTNELNAFRAALNPPTPAEPQYVQTRPSPGPVENNAGVVANIKRYWTWLWQRNEQFWAAVGRLFSLRKD